MATPEPPICIVGATIQNAVVHPFLKSQLEIGAPVKNIGHA